MKGKGPKQERETIVNFNEEDATASIWTASETVYRRLLKRLGRAYLTEDAGRHAVFVFPMNFLDLPRVKAKKTLTPEQRALLASRMADRRKLPGAESKEGLSQ